MSTGGVGESGCRPPTRAGHPLGCPESPLRAKIKSGNQKKIDFPHPTSYMYEPRGCVYEVGFFVRYSSQRWPMAIAPAQWHVGCGGAPSPLCAPIAPFWRRRQPIFARSGRKTAPAPPAVCAHSAAPARPLAPKGREGTATCAPATYQILLSAQMATRKNEIFRSGQLLLLRGALEPTHPRSRYATDHK